MNAEEFNREFGRDMSPLFQLATALHEMYINLCTAGFNEKQALYLTSKMVTHTGEIDIQMEGE